MNHRVRHRIRIVVLFILPLVGIFIVGQHVAEARAVGMSGVMGALRTLLVLVGLGTIVSFWLYSYDRPRFLRALLYTGLGFCLEGTIHLAIAMLLNAAQQDFDRSLQYAGAMLLSGAVIAVEGYQRTRHRPAAGNSL